MGDHDAICSRCHKGGLQWVLQGDKWVLLNEVGEPHQCNPDMLRDAVIDDFEDLDECL